MKKFTSRKFLFAVSAAVLIVLNEGLGLGIDPDAYGYIMGIVITYLASQGIIDVVKTSKEKVE